MDCREKIISEEYADFILQIDEKYAEFLEENSEDCPILTSVNYGLVYRPLNSIGNAGLADYAYSEIPKLYGLTDIAAIESTGATRLQNFPGLELGGRGVIIGIVDDGIDAYHEAFRYSNGNTRIIAAWDQTSQELDTPFDLKYGSYITREIINEELQKESSEILLNLKRGSSHGTYVAGIAAGNINFERGFASAAPYADIAMVKLKPAKQYLRDYYFIKREAVAYQENDIITAVNFLANIASQYRKPLIICIPLGTSFGAHNGISILGELLNIVGTRMGIGVCVANGNEGNSRHHFSGRIPAAGEYEDVEIRAAEGMEGFVTEIWGEAPDLFSVEIISPTGEKVPRFSLGIIGNQVFDLVFDKTKIYIKYEMVERKTGAELIRITFERPTTGIWTLRVYGDIIVQGNYNIWLPITEFVGRDTYFLRPDPAVTLTIPGDTYVPVSVGAYNHNTGAIYIESGRGYPTDMTIKPTISAPGVNVLGTGPDNSYVYRSGTSVSAGITAGIMAQFMEWGILRGNSINMSTTEIKNYLIRGATRKAPLIFPNREWGFGIINAYNSIDVVRK